MSATQFAMVEELAFLIKDNLPCKHLILSMEEALVNFLQDDLSSDGVLELEPMNAYNRLLLHRLADIFGFSHQSVGEGDDRHLVLERCTETSIPPVLVGDLVWQYDEFHAPLSHQLLRRKEDSPVSKVERPSFQFSLEEKEAAYHAARERIFSMDNGEANETIRRRPRKVPVVAQRMIAHALGQRINEFNQSVSSRSAKENSKQTNGINILEKGEDRNLHCLHTLEKAKILRGQKETTFGNPRAGELASSQAEKKTSQKLDSKLSSRSGVHQTGKSETRVSRNLKEENLGAAKRMFAHALGFHAAKGGTLSKCSQTKPTK